MRNFLTVIIFLFTFISNSNSQSDSSERKILDTTYVPYSKWPYLGPEIPPYFGFNFGYELATNSYTWGIHHNISHMTSYGNFAKTGGYLGYSLIYRIYQNRDFLKSFETEFGVYTFITFGFNLNYNIIPYAKIIGFKPFIGINLFHFQIIYAPHFYKRNKDPHNYLAKNTITFRTAIPIIKLTRKKYRTHFILEDKTEW